MKLATTAAYRTLMIVGVAAYASGLAWAAAPPPAASPAAAMQDQAACPTPAAANPKPTWKHGQDEYKDYTAAASATDPKQMASLAQAFIQKYPDSDYKNGALQLELQGQMNAKDQSAAFQTAQELAKSPGADADQMMTADTIISFLGPTVVQPTDAAGLAVLNTAATCGEQLASKMDPSKAAQALQYMNVAQDFVALDQKNYPDVVRISDKLIQGGSKDPMVYYWLGTAQIQTKDFSNGIFDLARAADLAPAGPGKDQINNYLTKIYSDYHGSTDGLPDVMTAAQSNPTPPAGFSVVDINTINQQKANAQYQSELAAQHQKDLQDPGYTGMVTRLQDPAYSAAEWEKIHTAKEALGLDGIVTDATNTEVEIKVGATDASQATTPDVKVILDKPLTAATRPKAGDKVSVAGFPESYTPNPFLLTLDKGTVKINK